MAETIKGGAYQSPDGTWHDANGKPLPSRKIKEAEELAAQQADEKEEAEEVATESVQAAPAMTHVPQWIEPPKRSRKSKGSK